MKAPASALWIRLLGYGGAALLVAAAAVVLVLQWRGGTSTASAGSTASPSPSDQVPGITLAPSSAGRPSSNGSKQPGPGTSSQPIPTGRSTDDPLTSTSRCKASFASYQRSGSTVKVSVTKPQTGLVAAYIQIKGQDTPLTQSFTADGTKGKHVFVFTGVPAAQVQKISVGIISTVTLQNCDLT